MKGNQKTTPRWNHVVPLLLLLGATLPCCVMANQQAQEEWTFQDLQDHFPQGELDCSMGKRQFDPLLQKETYYVGVHAPAGVETAWREYNLTFQEYLDQSVGERFDPPINFKMKVSADPLLDWVDNKDEVDFMYSDTGLSACIGVEIGAQPIATTVSRLEARGRTYDLDMFGGTMLVRADNDRVNSVEDLKGKVIGALAISDFAGAQVQFFVMKQAGVDYINDPKQVVFTDNQEVVVRGLVSGKWDAGFVRTGQIERTRDENGNLYDPDLFKIIEPKIYVTDEGTLFPFLHSTPVFPEWHFYARHDINRIVSEEVQAALMKLQYFKKVGDAMQTCQADVCRAYAEETKAVNGTAAPCTQDVWEVCDRAPAIFFDPLTRCDTTRSLADLASRAGIAGRHNGFRPPRSHFSLRTMQQAAGFVRENDKGEWACLRAATLYDGINCPEGHYKVPQDVFDKQCDEVNLPCPEGMSCFCQPCIQAFEVDVFQFQASNVGDSTVVQQGGCAKMSICATIEQTEEVTMRIMDNVQRENLEVTALIHLDRETVNVLVRQLEPFLYEIVWSDNYVGVGVLEVFFDGAQIPQSPFRIQVVERSCDHEDGKVTAGDGQCVCSSDTVEMQGRCIKTLLFAVVGSIGGVILVAIVGCFYIRYQRRKNDEIWHINLDELHMDDPPEVVGTGSFGVVLCGEYRGTKVAIKRAVKTRDRKRNSGHGSRSKGSKGSRDGSNGVRNSSKHPDSNDKEKDSNTSDEPDDVEVGYPFHEERFQDDAPLPGEKSTAGTSNDPTYSLGFLAGDLGYHHQKRGFAWLCPWRKSENDYNYRFKAAIFGSSGTSSMSKKSVAARMCPWFSGEARREAEFMSEMRILSRLRHPCITTVMGAVVSNAHEPMLVMEYMEHGSLYDLLRNETLHLSGDVILQIVRDVAQGLRFLHSSKPPVLHGDLKARNILIDSRLRGKLCDFGLSNKKASIITGTPYWLAPEYLRGQTNYTPACDIYSMAIILYEIYSRKSPYEGENFRDTLRKVCDRRVNKRPPIPAACGPSVVQLMKKCWSPDPYARPDARDLDNALMELSVQDADPVVELERASGDMLFKLFPKKVAVALQAGQKVEPEQHEMVSVICADVVEATPEALERLEGLFERLAPMRNVFNIQTVGQACLGVTNLENTSQRDTHMKEAVEFALDLIQQAPHDLNIRIGINSGPVTSQVIGTLNPRFGLFGDTVNTASRLESHPSNKARRVLCTEASYKLLLEQADGEVKAKKRSRLTVKGKGEISVFWLGPGVQQQQQQQVKDVPPPEAAVAAERRVGFDSQVEGVE